jgi:hypothetical protein
VESLIKARNSEDKEHFLRALETTGRSQNRYLWALVIFGGLVWTSTSAGSPGELEPFGIPLDEDVLLLVAPSVLALLLIVFFGAARRVRWLLEARGKQKQTTSWLAQHDPAPSALDLMIFVSPKKNRWLRAGLSMTYVLFLFPFLLQATYLTDALWGGGTYRHGPEPLTALVAGVVATGLTIAAIILYLHYWVARCRMALAEFQSPSDGEDTTRNRAMWWGGAALAGLISALAASLFVVPILIAPPLLLYMVVAAISIVVALGVYSLRAAPNS